MYIKMNPIKEDTQTERNHVGAKLIKSYLLIP